MSQLDRLLNFFSRQPVRAGLLFLLLASTGLTLALPLEFQTSLAGYPGALVRDWPLLASGVVAWALLALVWRRKWDWR